MLLPADYGGQDFDDGYNTDESDEGGDADYDSEM